MKEVLVENEFSDLYVSILPAILAILTVNVIIILFIISAFKREETIMPDASDVSQNASDVPIALDRRLKTE